MWKKCEEKEDQKRNEMKGMRGRENDQNIEEHLKGEKGTVLAKAFINYYFKLVSIKTNC